MMMAGMLLHPWIQILVRVQTICGTTYARQPSVWTTVLSSVKSIREMFYICSLILAFGRTIEFQLNKESASIT